jgi:hypothetical protein
MLFKKIQNELNLASTFPSGTRILELLISMGLANRISVENIPRIIPSKEFFSIGIQEANASLIDPVELLQAYFQSGIICYFSALYLLDLTTQQVTHHHIAIPTKPPINSEFEESETSSKINSSPLKSGRSKLGTPSFFYQDIPFYSTRRFKNTIPGLKVRILSPRTQVRMTTIEQTLLDTLQYPYHCGGPDPIFEAWKNGLALIDEDLLHSYLEKIDIPPLTRRTGAILDLFDHRPEKNLEAFLNKSRSNFIENKKYHLIPLLRGIDYSRLNEYWNVSIP